MTNGLSPPSLCMSFLLWSLLAVILHFPAIVQGDIISLDVIVDASSDEVHFVKGYLKAPASIDLSAVTFLTTSEPDFALGDDEFMGSTDDDNKNNNDDDIVATNSPEGNDAPTNSPVPAGETSVPTVAVDVPSTTIDNNTDPTLDGDGGNRLLQRVLSSFQTTRSLDDGSAKQIMDIVLFMVPEDCKKDSWGTCDWAKLGVGTYDDKMEGGMSYCCSRDTAGRGLCDEDDIGTLIVNNVVFQGDHRKVIVPQSTDQEFKLAEPKFDIGNSGEYVLVISNCNDFGLEVLALGSMEWKSAKGYLPGDMFELMLFYGALTVFYFVLVVWYYCGMRIYQDATIPIQRYILGTMLLGLFEVLFRTTDLVIWNDDGLRNEGVMYTAMSLGVLKRGVSRCLGVMVAMGWGVVRDSLGSALVKIIVLGILYSALTLARDFFILAAEDVQTISMSTKYYELMDFAWILTLLVILINLVFYFWIIFALNSTTEYLRNMNQTSKLKRHLKLRCLILTSMVIVGIWLLVYIVQTVTAMLTQNLVWILEAVMHANYLFILVGVSILWRPNSQAKDYAMQMEIPSLSCDENELELSCNVPSADDMGYDDGNDPDHQNGIRVNNAVLG